MKPAIPCLAAIALNAPEQPDGLHLQTLHWQPLGIFPSKRKARQAVKAQDCALYLILRLRSPGEHALFDRLHALLQETENAEKQ